VFAFEWDAEGDAVVISGEGLCTISHDLGCLIVQIGICTISECEAWGISHETFVRLGWW